MIYRPVVGNRDQFDRDPESHLLDYLPSNCMILGLGGIGGHVADILGSLNSMESIMLFDDDVVELSNLNRTIYSYKHLGKYKVDAISEIISSRNCAPQIIPINSRFNTETCQRLNENKDFDNSHYFTVFDCRDNYYGDYDLLKKLNLITDYYLVRAAYNGMSITLDTKPEDHPVWGQGGYTENTSHSIPSRMAALLAVIYAAKKQQDPCNKYFEKPLTFNVENIIEHLIYGVKCSELDPVNSTKLNNLLFPEKQKTKKS